jgi:hypothetical protein
MLNVQENKQMAFCVWALEGAVVQKTWAIVKIHVMHHQTSKNDK